MQLPELVAQPTQPPAVTFAALATPMPEPVSVPQQWEVSVANAKYHWYDLIAGFPAIPDIRDPIGRYMRRMQFELEAATENHHLFFVVTRPRIRFDTARPTQWGFFSLKLTLPLLVGADELKEAITIELSIPFAATVKKPTISVTENLLTLNWGGMQEVLSVHDVLQNYENGLKIPSKVVYVGQTRDPAGRLSKGRLPEVQKLHHQYSEHHDTLLLVKQMQVSASSELGDPAAWPANQSDDAADAVASMRMDVLEAALIRYFEGAAPRGRNADEKARRQERLRAIAENEKLEYFAIKLDLPEAGNYRYLASEQVASSRQHLLDCVLEDGHAIVTRREPAPGTLRARA